MCISLTDFDSGRFLCACVILFSWLKWSGLFVCLFVCFLRVSLSEITRFYCVENCVNFTNRVNITHFLNVRMCTFHSLTSQNFQCVENMCSETECRFNVQTSTVQSLGRANSLSVLPIASPHLFFIGHTRSATVISFPQWGAADAEIKVPSVENTELEVSHFKACRSV